MKERIQTLDGLRFLAAIGVLWIHVWTAHGNPRWRVGKLDVADLLAIGGNGVGLFFVISGFCMYYFYANKPRFNYKDLLTFLKKRWVRLSPAFYVATVVYICVNKYAYNDSGNAIYTLLNSIFYLNAILPNSAGSHFWTLSVEWQFYVLIPIILIYQQKIGFGRIFATIFSSIILISIILVIFLKRDSDLWSAQIFFRGSQFGGGVLVAYMLLKYDHYLKNRVFWLFASIIVLYVGRVLISNPVLLLSINYYNMFKLAGFMLMGVGFSGILYLSLTSKKYLAFILGNKLFKTMGRISYSFYLWHLLLIPVVTSFVSKNIPQLHGIAAPIFSTLLCTAILYPISKLSFRLLEQPFLSAGNLTGRKTS